MSEQTKPAPFDASKLYTIDNVDGMFVGNLTPLEVIAAVKHAKAYRFRNIGNGEMGLMSLYVWLALDSPAESMLKVFNFKPEPQTQFENRMIWRCTFIPVKPSTPDVPVYEQAPDGTTVGGQPTAVFAQSPASDIASHNSRVQRLHRLPA